MAGLGVYWQNWHYLPQIGTACSLEQPGKQAQARPDACATLTLLSPSPPPLTHRRHAGVCFVGPQRAALGCGGRRRQRDLQPQQGGALRGRGARRAGPGGIWRRGARAAGARSGRWGWLGLVYCGLPACWAARCWLLLEMRSVHLARSPAFSTLHTSGTEHPPISPSPSIASGLGPADAQQRGACGQGVQLAHRLDLGCGVAPRLRCKSLMHCAALRGCLPMRLIKFSLSEHLLRSSWRGCRACLLRCSAVQCTEECLTATAPPPPLPHHKRSTCTHKYPFATLLSTSPCDSAPRGHGIARRHHKAVGPAHIHPPAHAGGSHQQGAVCGMGGPRPVGHRRRRLQAAHSGGVHCRWAVRRRVPQARGPGQLGRWQRHGCAAALR